jgi:hypothetical protein
MIRRNPGIGNCNGDNDCSMNGVTGADDAGLDDIEGRE